jgi:hypothetical protein
MSERLDRPLFDMILRSDQQLVAYTEGELQMKKLMTIMLGLSFLVATVSVGYTQDKKDSTKKQNKKKGGKKKTETPKKDGGQ